MQKKDLMQQESEFLKKLSEMEDLAEKKTKIYSRLLMDVALAKNMETLSERHQKRKTAIERLAFGKAKQEEEDETEE